MKKFLLASVTLVLLCSGCASDEVASNSPDDINAAGVDTSVLSSDLPPTTSAEAAPTPDPVSKVNVSSAASTTETNITQVTPVVKIARHRHARKHHRKAVLVHHKHRRHHRKHSLASM